MWAKILANIVLTVGHALASIIASQIQKWIKLKDQMKKAKKNEDIATKVESGTASSDELP